MEASYLGKRAGSVADTNYSLVLFIPPTEISLDWSEISRTVLLARLSIQTKRTTNRKITIHWDLAYRAMPVTGLARLPYKTAL